MYYFLSCVYLQLRIKRNVYDSNSCVPKKKKKIKIDLECPGYVYPFISSLS